ncbi:septal ring lytic transglycosylase RlpA family protein [Alkanindiges sp. WGS2144]|uniref:septal ring lytic transglycosylase RlpA family protein n=1 Tax=Alkanindiges sp. WGS2144 TaxID=3366808 RepID=UPI003752C118
MQKSVFSVLTLSIGLAFTTATHAELVQAQPLSNSVETANLANRVLDQGGNISSALFKANSPVNSASNIPIANKPAAITALSITEVSGNRIKTESVPARIEVSSKEEPGIIDRLSAVASEAVRKFTQSGMASWYGRQFHGRKTASGETFDMYAMTAAHRSLPLNCYIRVTNKDNGKSVIVKVNDRGPFHGNRVLDLSYAAANKLGIANRGIGNVTIERVDGP